jgi:tyrosinase
MSNGTLAGTIRRPAVPRPIRIRRSVRSLGENDPILTYYGRAIAEMKKKLIANPLSWRYQAAIHDYDPGDDPSSSSSDVLATDQATYWSACQHASWFFLPWHRMYLHHFENMIMSEVMELGGPEDWALPYWNYSEASPESRILPKAFQKSSTTGLYVPQRAANANAGLQFAGTPETNISDCLSEPLFTGVPSGSPGFGGLPGLSHNPRPGKGMLERSPHDRMHGAINGSTSADELNFMGNFTRAPLDPIFWVHHCNIDRLWEVWVQSHVNPTDSAWLNQSFSFHDATGAAVTMTPAQVVDTRDEPLSYMYDDIKNPLSP